MTIALTDPAVSVLLWLCVLVGAAAALRLAVGVVMGVIGWARAARGRELGWLARPRARRWLGAGFGLALAALPGTTALAGQPSAPTTAVMVPLDPAPPTTGDPTTAVMVPLDPAPPDPPPISEQVPAAPLQPAPTSTADASPLWTVEPGEHLWHIAEQTLLERSGRAEASVSDLEIATYLERLVERNRAVLPDPGNPDLIHPGQVMELPS